MSDDMAKGCNNCPARSKCEGLTYRGSDCAALRHRYGASDDPEIHSGADDLISRKALAKAAKNISSSLLNEWDTLGVLELIYRQPAVDAAPVRHGRWIYKSTYYELDECDCSECGQLMTTPHGKRMNFCPNCAAKMDGGEEE